MHISSGSGTVVIAKTVVKLPVSIETVTVRHSSVTAMACVGVATRARTEMEKEDQVEAGDTLYIYSDGFFTLGVSSQTSVRIEVLRDKAVRTSPTQFRAGCRVADVHAA